MKGMAFDNKVILDAVIQLIGKSDTLEEAYKAVVSMASVEGKEYPSFEDFKKQANISKK